ncbi:NAD-dependent epimerase/dehydratase family protein [Hoyosella subflava]|uniref:NAD dependent epimerase/dehydratase family protein n=1 Tax=Hoyosella subflava (strain DSM 45089 / JCM 17490 / NBRC 109087 / DQS3-9A1) TaxID=443218 RepID=F6EKC0_HOYSD|nr:NAD-dependent epimerase/dehydratase family protein [Hoyosella subflava]AEF39091.1 NAD dependent epimerase/dehydratase family protein [Hoyosella subflava DQS3-9A1]
MKTMVEGPGTSGVEVPGDASYSAGASTVVDSADSGVVSMRDESSDTSDAAATDTSATGSSTAAVSGEDEGDSARPARDNRPRVVLVTGASRFLGGFLTARLAQNPDIERVIAVDAVPPSKDMRRRMGRADFVRADIRNPLIAKVVRNAEVDTVVHLSMSSHPSRAGGRAATKEMNVIGAMQLLAACQKSSSVKRVVLKSSSTIYGSSSKDPAMFTEEMSARRPPKSGYARDCLDVEGYTRALGRRRPDIATTILRLAPIIGPRLETELSRFLLQPLVPTIMGRDPRMQLLHEEDALAALERSAISQASGTFNIAADGVVALSQAIRRAGGVQAPMFPAAFAMLSGLQKRLGMHDYSSDQFDYLVFGCGMDTTRMQTRLGFRPRWTTLEAFDDLLRSRRSTSVIDPDTVRRLESKVVAAAARWA